MPYAVVQAYESLTATEQNEVMDFIAFLVSKREKNVVKDTSFIDDMQGIFSHEECEDARASLGMKFKEFC